MIKHQKQSLTLGLKIFLITVGSIFVSLFVFVVTISVSIDPIATYVKGEERIHSRMLRDKQDLQHYIIDNDITEMNIEDLSPWLENHKYMIIYIVDVDNNNIVYTNDDLFISKELEIAGNTSLESTMLYIGGKYFYIDMLYSVRAEVENYATYLGLTLSSITFLLVFYYGIRNITKRVKQLTNEIEIIGAGTPNSYISDKGNDELGRLSFEINALITELSQKNQELVISENALKELVTSLAHDLRTPLTSLIGYITLIKLESQSEDIEELANRCEQKALQMKTISDELFSLFSTLSLNEDSELPLERVYVQDFIEGAVDRLKSDLKLNEFEVEARQTITDDDYYVNLNLYYMDRLFENIISNLLKYAEPMSEIQIQITLENLWCTLEISNITRIDQVTENASGFGLLSCRKIVDTHKGHFSTSQNEGVFITKVELPINP
ncbi:HAMP domain-containing histidine kinase [Erysipelothrix sp. strain 2 (EsS2-7-Brazil)]|uniref:sensor histidine kinase n=1 Tax=Erysipelothrix sp. strain 2 (EsS2-7-Brazil) TaxID=2500579 RepID=UPI00190CEB23|nr:HAMP domain-containing sensor histidine kinase [Erysipelothrix sp. strain 2 (EsS2-7-Brazil)]MBK2403464.1 HAMP domain-containing histidine kinase [Erysipelothrix sp. strain 2 (EsS2-7-Brazil)]